MECMFLSIGGNKMKYKKTILFLLFLLIITSLGVWFNFEFALPINNIIIIFIIGLIKNN